MVLLRTLFFSGLVLVVVHRLTFPITPVWFDIFVAVYLAVVIALFGIVLLVRRRVGRDKANVDEVGVEP